MINLLKYKFSYYLQKIPPLPLSLTLNLTSRCNLKCKTCKIWKIQKDELSVSDYEKIFKSINQKIPWITLTGGEVFLRDDIFDIILNIYKYLKPKFLNIPTNGMLTGVIINTVEKILTQCKSIKLKINVSIDDIGERQDRIRGKGSFNNAVNTFVRLKKIKNKNLTTGIGCVISKYNVSNYQEICELVNILQPDSFVWEIAQNRLELQNIGDDIAPSFEKYKIASDYLIKNVNIKSNIFLNFFRKRYYNFTIKTLKQKKEIIKCFAGIASCYITSDGDIWECPVAGNSLGNLREENFDFKKIWQSEQAKKVRKKIKDMKCFCTLANTYYTNMLMNLI